MDHKPTKQPPKKALATSQSNGSSFSFSPLSVQKGSVIPFSVLIIFACTSAQASLNVLHPAQIYERGVRPCRALLKLMLLLDQVPALLRIFSHFWCLKGEASSLQDFLFCTFAAFHPPAVYCNRHNSISLEVFCCCYCYQWEKL